jgi:gas vesicle protein
MEINSLVQIFGSAGVTFYVMWLWLQSIQLEKKGIINKLELEQENRIKELKEMLPLLNDASKGLQDVIKTNDNKNQEVIETIIKHIDDRIEMISSRCNNKDIK